MKTISVSKLTHLKGFDAVKDLLPVTVMKGSEPQFVLVAPFKDAENVTMHDSIRINTKAKREALLEKLNKYGKLNIRKTSTNGEYGTLLAGIKKPAN